MPAQSQPNTYCLTRLDAIERALDSAPLASWEALRERDAYATFFQGRVWTLSWYRAYRELFDPALLVLHQGSELLGLATMAVDKRTHRLAFAGDHMADYRDVVAGPGHREAVLRALVRLYREGGYSGALRVGSTLPESPSADLLMKVAREQGVPALRSSHSGWRWWADKAGNAFESRSARYKLNCLRRRGDVVVSRVGTEEEWAAAREGFYRHHSLRQIYRGTVVSFDKPEKRAFTDALLRASLAHVTVLKAGDQAIAWHYGYQDRGLLYWGAPAFDVREHRYSPSLVLLLLIMQHARQWDIRGVDMTIGQGELKERNSTDQVALPTVQLFQSRRSCAGPRALQIGASTARRLFAAFGREDTWTRQVRPNLQEAMVHLREAAAMRPRQAMRHLRTTLIRFVAGRGRTVAFVADARDIPAVTREAPGSQAQVHVNEVEDLLRFPQQDRYALSRVRAATFALAEGTAGSADLHTMMADGRLLGWAFCGSHTRPRPSGIADLTVPAGAAVLWGAEIIDGSASRLTELIRSVTAHTISRGAREVWLLADSPSRGARRAIEEAGFRLERSARSRWRRSARPKEAAVNPG